MNIGPKLRDRRHLSYNEGANEPQGLIDTDIEMEHPSDDNEPMEQVQEPIMRPMFDE